MISETGSHRAIQAAHHQAAVWSRGRKRESERGHSDRGEVQVPDQLPDAVKGIVRVVAIIGPTCDIARSDALMNVFEAAVDFSYPAREPRRSRRGHGGDRNADLTNAKAPGGAG